MNRDDVMRETLKHVRRVGNLMLDVVERMQRRAMSHDDSKFSEVEFPSFAEETPKLREMTYGSDEYKEALKRLGPALESHYYHNRHHPEYWAMDDIGSRVYEDQVKSGQAIESMNLIDLIEMLADWKAATERHEDGDLRKSIEHNAQRFGYSDHTKHLLLSTAEYLGWFDAGRPQGND